MEERILDCRGLSCPQPVLNTKEALENMPSGILTVIVDNETAGTNVSRFLESQGLEVELQRREGDWSIRTFKAETAAAAREPTRQAAGTAPDEGGMVVYICSEAMGRGDDGLGKTLMAAYLDTLSHFAGSLERVILVNSGVKLAVEGSPVLESLRNLRDAGVPVASCGTCLDHFGLRERIGVGEVTNMYSIVEAVSRARKVMMP